MPLYQLAKVSTFDVADAFCVQLPSLDCDRANEKDFVERIPSYWATEDMVYLPYDGRQFQRNREDVTGIE